MKVSVCCITYNHEPFIGQAIESMLQQQTGFEFDIVVGEDCSTDHTREILKQYAADHPGKIKLLLNEKNIGVFANLNQTLQACSGEYIAICDGDDFWIDQHKLRKQSDFLDQHKQCSLCYTNNFILRDGDQEWKELMIKEPTPAEHDFKWMLNHFAVASPSTWMFRAAALPRPLPDWMKTIYHCDVAMEGLLSMNGTFGFLDFPAAVYRIHGGGIISAVSDSAFKSKDILYLISQLTPLLSNEYRKPMALHKADHLEYLAFEALRQKQFSSFFTSLFKAIPFQYAKSGKSWRVMAYRFNCALRQAMSFKRNI